MRPRRPVASQTLLSAALGGLLSFSASCHLPDGALPDARATADTGVTVDAAAARDAAGERDARPMTDAAPDDATMAMDGSEPDAAGSDAGELDATMAVDGSAPLDAPAADATTVADGSLRDAFCDVDPDARITSSTMVADLTLEDFTAMCDDLGGFIEIHPHCGGMNSCRGISYDSGTGVLTEHTCAGLNTCTGFSCITG